MARARIFSLVPSALYSSQEVADYLQIQRQTLEAWRRTGAHPELRFRRVGRRIRYLGKDVMAWLDGDKREKRVRR